jgi:hypothetical protein
MKSSVRNFFCLTSILVALALASSCAVTTAPTKSSSQTTGNTSEASTKFTSSTSPGGGDSSSEGEQAKALEFTNENFARVKSDMAVGGGEYLESLSALLGVPESRRPEFYSLTKKNFSVLVSSEDTTAEEMLTKLRLEISARPELVD